MKLTLKTDYAFRILIFLQKKEKATIKEIADFYNIKKNHLSVVVNKLSELGYISSSTGPSGGITINSLALKMSVAEIVLQFEELNLVECFNKSSNQCVLNSGCKLKSILKKAKNSFINELSKHTLDDLI